MRIDRTHPWSAMPGPQAARWPVTRPPIGQINPGSGVLSPGNTVTSDDIAMFDMMWMTEDWRNSYLGSIVNALEVGFDPYGLSFVGQVWRVTDRMEALVRMYELTGVPKYLDQVREFAMRILSDRDDHRPDSLLRIDQFRWKVMPAWGTVGVDQGYYYLADRVVAFKYSYPIAAFARIVAENPALYDQYGADAKAAATQVLETMQAFVPELIIKTGSDGGEERIFLGNDGWRLLTPDRCQWAYDTALAKVNSVDPTGSDKFANEDRAVLKTQHDTCNANRGGVGKPEAHNVNTTFMIMLIELSRALDSDLFRLDDSLPVERKLLLDAIAKRIIPQIVASMHRYYINRLEVDVKGEDPFYKWRYQEEDPKPVYDDTSHANLEMKYIGLLQDNWSRLDALLAASGFDKIRALDNSGNPLLEGFANTFLYMVAGDVVPGISGHLAFRVDGTPTRLPGAYDWVSDGWLALAKVNGLVYSKCETVSLRGWDSSIDNPNDDPNIHPTPFPVLWEGNHAALLALKQFRPPVVVVQRTIVPDVLEETLANAERLILDAGLVPASSGSGRVVTSQSPPAGANVVVGSTVNIVLKNRPIQ